MKGSSFEGFGGTKTGLAIFGGLTVLLIYMIWLGVSGRFMPDWMLWATLIF